MDDYLKIIKFVLNIGRIFGVFSVSVDKINFFRQTFDLFQCLPFWIFYFHLYTRAVNEFYSLFYENSDSVVKFGDLIFINLNTISNTARILYFVTCRAALRKILLEIDYSLKKLKILIFPVEWRNEIFITLSVLLVAFILDFLFFYYVVYDFSFPYYFMYVQSLYIGLFKQIIDSLILDGIKYQFVYVNEELRKFLRKFSPCHLSIKTKINKINFVLRKNVHIKELALKINLYLGVSTIPNLMTDFLMLTLCSHYSFVTIQPKVFRYSSLKNVAQASTWAIIVCLKLSHLLKI